MCAVMVYEFVVVVAVVVGDFGALTMMTTTMTGDDDDGYGLDLWGMRMQIGVFFFLALAHSVCNCLYPSRLADQLPDRVADAGLSIIVLVSSVSIVWFHLQVPVCS